VAGPRRGYKGFGVSNADPTTGPAVTWALYLFELSADSGTLLRKLANLSPSLALAALTFRMRDLTRGEEGERGEGPPLVDPLEDSGAAEEGEGEVVVHQLLALLCRELPLFALWWRSCCV
jgi:hypothetical protein